MSEDGAAPETKRDKATAQRRAKILEAAVTAFLENGYHQTGVRDIARRAGVSLGNLYNHFPGKHDVLAEIATLERQELESFLGLLGEPAPAPEILDRFITAYAAYVAAPETVLLTIEITSEAVRKPDIGALFLANRERLVAALASVLQRGMADGAFRAMADARQAAYQIIDLIDGAAYRSVLNEGGMQEMAGALKDFVVAAVRA